MGARLVKQPNGRATRWSSNVDCITHIELTEEDYVAYQRKRAAERAEIDAHHVWKVMEKYGSSAPLPFSLTWEAARDAHLEKYPEEQDLFTAIDQGASEEEIVALAAAHGYTETLEE